MNGLVAMSVLVCGQYGFRQEHNYYHVEKNIYVNNETEYDREMAKRARIENWDLYVRTRWKLQDEWAAREKARLSYLDRLERRTDALERAVVLNARYKALTGKNP